jgi:hypothetical protein
MDVKTLVTQRSDMLTDAQISAVQIVTVPWWKIILIRASRSYLQSLVGLLTVTGTPLGAAVGFTLEAPDFMTWLVKCASIALAPGVIALLMNALELLNKLDASHPELRA